MNREQQIERAAEVLWRTDLGEENAAQLGWGSVSNQESYRRQASAVLDAILPQVTTVAELEALPEDAVIVTVLGMPLCKVQGVWEPNGVTGYYPTDTIFDAYGSPVTVVFTPATSGGAQ